MGKAYKKFFVLYEIPPKRITKLEREKLFELVEQFEPQVNKRNLFRLLNKHVNKGWLNFNVKHVFDAIYFLKSGGNKWQVE